MKNIFTLVFLALLTTAATAQSGKLQRADALYRKLAFSKAIDLYRDIIVKEPSNSYAMFRLANSYRLTSRPDQAAVWYEKALQSGTGEPVNYLHYAQTLRQLGKYDEAAAAYTSFLKWFPEDKRGLKGLEACRNANYLLMRPAMFESKPITINTAYSEFAPAYGPKGLVFSSDRKSPLKVNYTFPWTGTPYLDNFVAPYDATGGLLAKDVEILRKGVNSAYHDANAVFSQNGRLMAFTRNQYIPGTFGGKLFASEQDGVVKLKIMVATWNDEKMDWNEPFPASFVEPGYSYTHPAFGPDGRTLYFTSDMPAGYGGTDIWKAAINDNLTFERPENLGPDINTPGEEMFPALDKNNNLYFASSTHPGLGGLDIFRARWDAEKNKYMSVVNPGAPLNSSRDDFGLILNVDNNTGYFASNRPGGAGADDIYAARLNGIYYEVEVYNASNNQKLEGISITVTEPDGKTVTGTSDRNGRFFYPMLPDREYKISFSGPNFRDAETMVYTTDVPAGTTLEDQMGMMCGIGSVIRGLVLEEKSMLPVKDATVKLLNQDTGEEMQLTTDKGGAYTFLICPDISYTITASKNGYEEDRYNFTTRGMTEKTDKLQNLVLKGGEFICNIEFNNIYFDLDKHDIRADASADLEVMYNILTGSPTVRVEVGAHTDSRAGNGYNLELSRKRAKAVVNYLVSRGISKSRIVSKGYGESELKNHCRDNVQCSEEEHQANRRVEFRLIDRNNKVMCKSKPK